MMDPGKRQALLKWIQAVVIVTKEPNSVTDLQSLKDGCVILSLASKLDNEIASGPSSAENSAQLVLSLLQGLYGKLLNFRIAVDDILNGDELQIAKTVLLLLSSRAVVECGEQFIVVAMSLSEDVQAEIRQMIEPIFEPSCSLKDDDLGRLLATKLENAILGAPAAQSTPVGYTEAKDINDSPLRSVINRRTPSAFSNSSPRADRNSPLLQLVCSPSFDRKLMERNLCRQLELFKTQNTELESALRLREEELDQKVLEIRDLNTKITHIQRELVRCTQDSMPPESEPLEYQLALARNRQQETAVSLKEARDRCEHLEADNAQLYEELSLVKSQCGRLSEFDSVHKANKELTSQKHALDIQLAAAVSENQRLRDGLVSLQKDFDLQQDMYYQLQAELHHERSMSFINQSGECLGGLVEKGYQEQITAVTEQKNVLTSQLSSLTAERHALLNNFTTASREIDELKDLVSSLQSQIHTTEIENRNATAELHNQLKQHEEKLVMSRKEVISLEDVVNDLGVQRTRVEEALNRASDHVRSLETELRITQCREEQLEEELEAAACKCLNMEDQLEAAENERSTLLSKVTDYAGKLQCAEERFLDLNNIHSDVLKEIEDIKDKLRTASSHNALLENINDALIIEKDRLSESLATLVNDLQTSIGRVSVLEEQLAASKVREQQNGELLEASNSRILDLEEMLTASENREKHQKELLQTSANDLQSSIGRVSVLEEQLVASKVSEQQNGELIETLNSKISDLEEMLTASENREKHQKELLQTSANDLQSSIGRVSVLEEQLAASKVSEQQNGELIETFNSKISDLEEMLTASENREKHHKELLQTSANDLQSSIGRVSVLEEQLAASKVSEQQNGELIETLNSKISDLEEMLTASENREKHQKELLQTSANDLQSSIGRVSVLEEQLVASKVSEQQNGELIGTLNSKISDLEEMLTASENREKHHKELLQTSANDLQSSIGRVSVLEEQLAASKVSEQQNGELIGTLNSKISDLEEMLTASENREKHHKELLQTSANDLQSSIGRVSVLEEQLAASKVSEQQNGELIETLNSKISDLEEMLTASENREKHHKELLQTSANDLQSSIGRVSVLEEQLVASKVREQQNGELLEASNSRILDLEEMLTASENREKHHKELLQTSANDLQSSIGRVSVLEEQLAASKVSEQQNGELIGTLNSKISDLEEMLTASENREKHHKELLQTSANDLQSSIGRVSVLEEQLAASKVREQQNGELLDASNSRISDLEEMLTASENREKHHKELLQTSANDLQSSICKVLDLEQLLAASKVREQQNGELLEASNSRISDLEEMLTASENREKHQKELLQTSANDLQSSICKVLDLEQLLAVSESREKQNHELLEASYSKLAALEVVLAASEERVKCKEDLLQASISRITVLQELLAASEDRESESQNKLKSTEVECQSLLVKLEEVQKNQQYTEAELDMLRKKISQLDALQKTVVNAETEIESLKRDKRELASQVLEFELKLQSITSECAMSNSALFNADSQKQELRDAVKMRNQEICQLAEERTMLEIMSMQANAEVQSSRDYSKQHIQKLEAKIKDLQADLDRAEKENQQLLSTQELLELKYISENQQLKKHFESIAYQLTTAKSQLAVTESESDQLQSSINARDDQIQRLHKALNEQKTINCHNERVIHQLELKLAQAEQSSNSRARAGQHQIVVGSSTSSISSQKDGNFDAISVSDLIPERDTTCESLFAVPRPPRDVRSIRASISQSTSELPRRSIASQQNRASSLLDLSALKADDRQLLNGQDNLINKENRPSLSRHSSASRLSVDRKHPRSQVSGSGLLMEHSVNSRTVANSSSLSSRGMDLNVVATVSNGNWLARDRMSSMTSLNQEMTDSLSKISLKEASDIGFTSINRRQTLHSSAVESSILVKDEPDNFKSTFYSQSVQDTDMGKSEANIRRQTLIPRGMVSVMVAEDEPEEVDSFNALHELSRIDELRRRNTLCLPHMRSVYPTESFEISSAKEEIPSQTTVHSHSDYSGSGLLASKRTSIDAQLSNSSLEALQASKRKSPMKPSQHTTPSSGLFSRFRRSIRTTNESQENECATPDDRVPAPLGSSNSMPVSVDALPKKPSHTFNIGFTPKKNVGRRVQQKPGDKKKPLSESGNVQR